MWMFELSMSVSSTTESVILRSSTVLKLRLNILSEILPLEIQIFISYPFPSPSVRPQTQPPHHRHITPSELESDDIMILDPRPTLHFLISYN